MSATRNIGAGRLGRPEQPIDQRGRYPMRCGREDGGQVIRSDVPDDLVGLENVSRGKHRREVMKELRDRLVGLVV
jgi:hypothetical protein